MLNFIKKIFNKQKPLEHIDSYEELMEKILGTTIEKDKTHQIYTSTQTFENLKKTSLHVEDMEFKMEKKRAEEVSYYMEEDEEEFDDDCWRTSRDSIDPEAYYDSDNFYDLDRYYDMDNYYP